MPSASPAAIILASSSSACSQLPNFRMRYSLRLIPSFSIDGFSWNGSQRTTTIAPMNTTVATATITRDDIATAGTASVAVSTPDQVVATQSLTFVITGPSSIAPTVSSLSPSSATHGGGDFEMRINGSGFGPNAFVEWNGSFIATAFISASQLVAYIPAAEIAASGSATVTVTNPAPGGGTSSNVMFTIN